MAENRIGSAVESDLASSITDYSVAETDTDAAGDLKENEWINTDWQQYLGYFVAIPELNAAINAKATWTVGKGFIAADEQTELLLDSIKGFGKDTFNTILENMIRTYYIAGDAFAEIVRDEDGNLINLKPLNPGKVKIVVDDAGILEKYRVLTTKGAEIPIAIEDMFHLARNRVADEIHGTSVIKAVENIILARNESIADYKIVQHWNVKPRWKHRLKTDDETEIAAYKAKAESAKAGGEDIFEPFDVSESELVTVPANATMNPLAWIEFQGDAFYEAVGTPKIIIGGAKEFTDGAAKTRYLAWQQDVEEEQLFVEEQSLAQLNLVIELEFPASIENDLLSDAKKDKNQDVAIQPAETTAGVGAT